MCGRFTLHLPPDLLAEIFGLAEIPVFPSRYNIAPTQRIAVIRDNAAGRRETDFLHWGLIPSWAKDKSVGNRMINARSETVAEKPAFRKAIRFRRCIVPASGFFEWRQTENRKLPFYLRLRDGSPMAFAGLWDAWKSPEGETVESCTILTTSSNELIEPLHDRMPVILHSEEYQLWLNREMTDPEKLIPLYRAFPADLMEMYPVSELVNSPRNDAPDLIEPIAAKNPKS
jgi:putative SOS response-associated peptidase YedK